MTFARNTFRWAGIYGVLALVPQYFLEAQVGRDYPPAVTHPEFYYGFLGVALAWQALFFGIARDPARMRPAMIPAVLEKTSFAAAVPVLWALGRAPAILLAPAAIDGVLAVLFVMAYRRTAEPGAGT